MGSQVLITGNLVERKVTEADYGWLYYLLAIRPPWANISHRRLPSWDEHCAYLERIGREWPAVRMLCENHSEVAKRLGYYYLTPMYEIGIHTEEPGNERVHQAVLSHIIKLNPGRRLIMNISPSNSFHERLASANGFCLCQHSYEFFVPVGHGEPQG